MADGDREHDQPSLELPKLGLRRRKKAAPPPPPVEDTAVEGTPVLPSPPAPELAEAPPLFVDEVEPVTAVEHAGPLAVDDVEPGSDAASVPARRVRRIPRPGGMPAAVLTGIVVGLGVVGLTWAGLRLCESVQGTSSCGGSGYPLLAAILVLMVVLGALLLRAAHVPDPGSTSFLAVGVTAVLALLFLVDNLLDPAMIVVIPLISAGSYALAHWVTRTFIEPAER